MLLSGGLTKAPVLLKQVEAPYPADAADAGAFGVVTLEVDLGPDGRVINARVSQSSGTPSLDDAALTAVKQFEFSPAELDGEPAAVRLEYRYHFELKPVVPEPLAEAGDAGPAPPVVNFTGQLKAAGTRDPIAGAIVVAAEHEAITDEKGRFTLEDVPVGPVHVIVTGAGWKKFESDEDIKTGERTDVVYYLREDGAAAETIVRGERDREVAQVKLEQAELKYMPGSGNEAFRVLQNLPGVARSPFNTGFLIVRGSKAWDSRVYIDDIFIPQLFHFGGLNATVSSALVQELTFQPGNFGAEHGRSIGGLVEADLRAPSRTGLHGFVDLSFFDVSALVETPLSDKWSVSASARKGLTELTLPFALKTFAPQVYSAVGFTLAPVYWDYQLRVERKGEGSNRFFVMLYGSSDEWAFVRPIPFLDPDSEGNQGSYGTKQTFNRLTVGLDHQLMPNLRFVSRNSLGFDQYALSGSTTNINYNGTEYPIQLREKLVIEGPSQHLRVNVGVDLLGVPEVVDAQAPPPFKANQIPDPFVQRRLLAEHSTNLYFEPALFIEASWKPFASLEILAGVRADYETYMNKGWLDPRLQVLWTPISRLTLKAGAGIYHQPPDYRSGELSAVFGNPGLRPEGANHYMAGAEFRFTDAIGLDVQGYYKDLFDQARQTLAKGLGSDVNIAGVDTLYTSDGYGRAYGLEVLLRHKFSHNLFGWISYSLSRFERDYYGGVIYAPGPLDQPHNLIAVLSYRLPLDFVVGTRVRFASGTLVTPIVASLYDTNGNYYYPLPGLPWSERLPDFFQLDVRIDKRFVFQSWVLAVYLDVQNVTNHKNVEGLFYNFDYTQKQYVYGVPILPQLGIRSEF
jgi:TonB family protein